MEYFQFNIVATYFSFFCSEEILHVGNATYWFPLYHVNLSKKSTVQLPQYSVFTKTLSEASYNTSICVSLQWINMYNYTIYILCTILLQERTNYSTHTCSNHSKRTTYTHVKSNFIQILACKTKRELTNTKSRTSQQWRSITNNSKRMLLMVTRTSTLRIWQKASIISLYFEISQS